jgi:murein DD-endopeptidase MepM/ murein hydrolase activator NlpD
MSNLKLWIQKLNRVGHERISIMVIPHNERHILNLQLSKYALLFTSVVLLSVITASIVSFFKQSEIIYNVSDLYDRDRAFQNEQAQYLNKYEALKEKNKEIIALYESLYEQSELENNLDLLLANNSAQKYEAVKTLNKESEDLRTFMDKARENNFELPFQEQLQDLRIATIPEQTFRDFILSEASNGFQYGNQVTAYVQLSLETRQLISIMENLNKFLSESYEVQQSLPYFWPMKGGHFTSFYGPRLSPFGYSRDFHAGIDLAEAVGTELYAAADGRIILASYNGGYGRMVKIQHRFGFRTYYAHMSRVYVRTGQSVKKGQLIGRVGATGRVTGPHLHYEVRVGDRHIDPLPFLTSL